MSPGSAPDTDALSEADRLRDMERAGRFWAAAVFLFAVLVAVHPPTVVLGAAAGWGITAALVVLNVICSVYVQRQGVRLRQGQLMLGALVGAMSVGVIQWLAGGGVGAPVDLILIFSVFGLASLLERPALIAYLVVVTVVVLAPVVYDTASADLIATALVFAAILWMEGLLSVDFGTRIRAQRTALVVAERASADQARTDPLTELGNRRALEDALREAFEGARDPVSVVYLDLNGFKTYNDRFGHAAGDALLRRLGRALDGALEPGASAFRVGGDEFCALLLGEHDAAHPAVAATVDALSEQGRGFSIAPSCGVVTIPREAADADSALRLADERMYSDKRSGRKSPAQEMSELLRRVVAECGIGLFDQAVDVAELAGRVGRRMGCTGEELDVIVRAAEQHDIGKLAVPDTILTKAGPLTEAEWELVRQHPVAGERILAGTPSLRPVARLIRATHERWDGGGYPDRLAGEGIALGARVVAACDAYCAMVSERPYRPAHAHDEALAELTRCAGTQFDPAVVAALRIETRALVTELS